MDEKSHNMRLKNNTNIKRNIVVFVILSLFLLTNIIGLPAESIKATQTTNVAPSVSINIETNSIIYEGDLIDCDISGEENKWWWIDRDQDGIIDPDENKHYTFWDDDPQIFRPETTPFGKDYVNLCVTASNKQGATTCSVTIKLYKIWFGEYHWHSQLCDGLYDHDEVINNTRLDDYLDWLGGCAHSGSIVKEDRWSQLNAALNYSDNNPKPGSFCAFPGYEHDADRWFKDTKAGHSNVLYKHLNPKIYVGFAYEFSESYRSWCPNWDELFYQLHQNETGSGKWAIVIPHHTNTGQTGLNGVANPTGTNFQVLFNDLTYPTKYQAEQYRLDHLRGTEIMQVRGEQIGGLTQGFSRLYYDDMPDLEVGCLDQAWADWGVFEASQTVNKGQQRFGFFGASDGHTISHLGSTINSEWYSYAGGITGCWAIHNTRDEIFEALNTTNVYALAPLKIRVFAEANGKRFGQWNSLTTPVTISISINASSAESEGRPYPYGAEENKADFPHNITDIWIIKNTDDHETNRIKAQVIHHKTFTGKNSNIYYEYVYNGNLKPGDYFWIAIDQEADGIMKNDDDFGCTTQPTNKHRVWISPFFVAAVHPSEEIVANAGTANTGIKNRIIQFHGAATGGTPPYYWYWDFGDGTTSTLQNPTHNYTKEGKFTVTLTVTDNQNKNNLDTATAIIENEDTIKPKVKISQAWNYIYKDTRNVLFLPLEHFPILTIIFGDMLIIAEASDEWGLEKVEFYKNNRLMDTDHFPPYMYTWSDKTFFRFRNWVKVVAYDNAGNKASDIIRVWKFP